MQLRTKIMTLFVGVVAITACLEVIQYITHSRMIIQLEESLEVLEQYVDQREHGVFFDPGYFMLTIQHKIAELAREFSQQHHKIYIQSVMWLIGLMVIFALGYTTWLRHIMSRLDVLRNFILDTYEHGPSHKRLELAGKDELSQVAKLINTSLDVHEAAKAELTGRVLENRKMVLALIRQFKQPVAYFRTNGDLVGSNMNGEIENQVAQLVSKHLLHLQTIGTQTEIFEMGAGESTVTIQGIGVVSGSQILIQVQLTK